MRSSSGGRKRRKCLDSTRNRSPPPPPPLARRSSRNRRPPDFFNSSPLRPSRSRRRPPKYPLSQNPNSKKKSNDPTSFAHDSITPEANHEGSWSSRLRSRPPNPPSRSARPPSRSTRPLRPTVRAKVAVLEEEESADLEVRTTPTGDFTTETDAKKQKKKIKDKPAKKDEVVNDSPELLLPAGEEDRRAEGEKEEGEERRSDKWIPRRLTRFVFSTPSRVELKEGGAVKESSSKGHGAGKNLDGEEEAAVALVGRKEGEEMLIPRDGYVDAVGRIGVVCGSMQGSKFSAPKGRVELKEGGAVKKSSSNGHGAGKNLYGEKEAAVALVVGQEGEGMLIPRDGYVDAVGRIGVVCGSMQRNRFSTPKGTLEVKKGKRGRESGDGEGGHGSLVDGWTSEQDRALEVAYLKARPTPHFWQKVAKMVPGKSKEQCFDRIHSKIITPPLTRRNSRTKKSNLSPVSHFHLSTSKPSTSFQKTRKKVKSKKKQKLHDQRMVRHTLRKHCWVDHGQEADLFPIFQACMDASAPETMCTNTSAKNSSISRTCFLNSNCKQLNARNLDKESKPSPDVLKKLRNPMLHEKYIDQLHCREGGWKVSSRMANGTTTKAGFLGNAALQRDTVKDARNTLLAITKFQHPKLPTDNNAESEDESCYDGSDESDVGDTFIGF